MWKVRVQVASMSPAELVTIFPQFAIYNCGVCATVFGCVAPCVFNDSTHLGWGAHADADSVLFVILANLQRMEEFKSSTTPPISH
jgi:hypothetical protein